MGVGSGIAMLFRVPEPWYSGKAGPGEAALPPGPGPCLPGALCPVLSLKVVGFSQKPLAEAVPACGSEWRRARSTAWLLRAGSAPRGAGLKGAKAVREPSGWEARQNRAAALAQPWPGGWGALSCSAAYCSSPCSLQTSPRSAGISWSPATEPARSESTRGATSGPPEKLREQALPPPRHLCGSLVRWKDQEQEGHFMGKKSLEPPSPSPLGTAPHTYLRDHRLQLSHDLLRILLLKKALGVSLSHLAPHIQEAAGTNTAEMIPIMGQTQQRGLDCAHPGKVLNGTLVMAPCGCKS
ncbi:neuromedin-B [Piliocolobus tephrosceles]|uniref:neuromedin-B n=1 Tax=Piliocolobus tephrosceles TaxID=591936 RepID=UPI001300FA4F|nr:neuromedin-B [Piliocolobus tephrosceles]